MERIKRPPSPTNQDTRGREVSPNPAEKRMRQTPAEHVSTFERARPAALPPIDRPPSPPRLFGRQTDTETFPELPPILADREMEEIEPERELPRPPLLVATELARPENVLTRARNRLPTAFDKAKVDKFIDSLRGMRLESPDGRPLNEEGIERIRDTIRNDAFMHLITPTPAKLPSAIMNLEGLIDTLCFQVPQQDLEINTNETSLPNTIGNLASLKHLLLVGNISSLPPEIGQLKALVSLLAGETNLTSLPPEIGKLSKLTELDLQNTELTSLPPQIGELRELTDLELGGTSVASLPPEIGNLSKLFALSLHSTALTSLPPEIGNLSELTALDLDDTMLASLPPEIGNLTKLNELLLRNTSLTTLPRSILNLNNLTLLGLENTPLAAEGDEATVGRRELRAHFGDRVNLPEEEDVVEPMPAHTTRDEVHKALDISPVRINRSALRDAKVVEVPGEAIARGDEFMALFNRVVNLLNFDRQHEPGYLEYGLLAGDFASDARDQGAANGAKVRENLLPRLTGYLKTLYGMPLVPGEQGGWQMYNDAKPLLKKNLAYILNELRSEPDQGQRSALFLQLVDGLLHCPTGQKEGVDTVTTARLEQKLGRSSDLPALANALLGLRKNAFFKTAVLTKTSENPQNVHWVSKYRDNPQLQSELGLTNVLKLDERIGTFGRDPFSDNPNNVLKVFYDLVTPQRMTDWFLEKCQTRQEMEQRRALSHLERKRNTKGLSDVERAQLTDQILALKAKIRATDKFKPINTQRILDYLMAIHAFDATNPSEHWWKAYFDADPQEDETAQLTRDGAMRLLEHLGYIDRNPTPLHRRA